MSALCFAWDCRKHCDLSILTVIMYLTVLLFLTHQLWSESVYATCCLYCSQFLLLSFLLFWNCNPSGHPVKHKSNSSAGELSLDFTIWYWTAAFLKLSENTHATLAHLNLSLRFIWLEVMCLSEGKKPTSSMFSLQCGSLECATPCKVAF